MTEPEKAEQYGRAMLDLRQAKFDLAAAQKKLSTATQQIQDVASSLQHFAANPTAVQHGGRPLADWSFAWHGNLAGLNLPDVVHEVFTAALRVQKLQAEVDAFEK